MQVTHKQVGLAGIAIVGLMCAASAFANDDDQRGFNAEYSHSESRGLKGAYGFSLTQSCVRAPFLPPPAGAFDPVTKALLVDGEIISSAGTGVLKFLSKGQVQVEDGFLSELSSSAISAGQTPVSAGTQFTCTGTHTPVAGSKLAVSLSCTVVSPQPGPVITLKPLNFEGYLGEDKRSIALTSARNEIHSVSVSVGGTVVQQRERICLQSMKLDKLP